jgi:hypothetical protein
MWYVHGILCVFESGSRRHRLNVEKKLKRHRAGSETLFLYLGQLRLLGKSTSDCYVLPLKTALEQNEAGLALSACSLLAARQTE